MSLKGRRFSLDSSVCLDGGGRLVGRRGSSMFSSKKSRQTHSLEDAQLEIQELNHNHLHMRKNTIAEENLDRLDGLISNNSFVKHYKTFHKLFQEIPEGENLTHSFTCALQKEVLYHGKMYISENHICFHSSVLLKDTKVVIPVSNVGEVKKHNSALSMLSVQTADGDKYSFVSLRNREMCYQLLQTVCSQAQGSPHLSSAENEGDQDMASSYSSLEDSVGCELRRQNSIDSDNDFPQMSSEGPTSATRQNSLTDEDDRGVTWIWRIIESVSPFFPLREIRNLSVLCYFYMTLMVLLLVVSGYIGLRIIALEEQLKSLGALTDLYLHNREYKEM
ncbi:GRAM domain-containing protein 2B [Larimichthys crocea]|uniref:Uncharacterized protein n=1 Tax=Larimichthys crocea TaxID=215358 RepID=A0ACD3QQS4_LARCR|nr:GRAM domain-containing protein 2B [Larimichthys crocea]